MKIAPTGSVCVLGTIISGLPTIPELSQGVPPPVKGLSL